MAAIKPGTNAIIFICITVFIDMIGVSLLIPVMPDLITSLTGKPVNEAASIGGVLLTTYALMQFLFAPIVGNLSDRFGRRPVILLALLGLAIDYVLMAIAPTLLLLFIGRILSGIFGATFPAANAYIADVSPPEKRGANFGIVSAAAGLGFICGPAIGGIIGEYGVRLPFIVAAILTFANMLYGYFVLPESLPPEKRRPFELKRANPFGSLLQIRQHPVILYVLTALFLMQVSMQPLAAVWAYYGVEQFQWSKTEIGVTVALYGFLIALVQGGLTRKFYPRFGEINSAKVGLVFGFISYLVMAFTQVEWLVYVGILLGALSGLTAPALQSLMSQRMGEDQQGELQGAIASAIGVAAIIGPISMTYIFSSFTDNQGTYFTGAAFFTSALIVALCLIVFSAAARKIGKET